MCQSGFTSVTAFNLVPRVPHLTAPGASAGGGKMRDPGNEVVLHGDGTCAMCTTIRWARPLNRGDRLMGVNLQYFTDNFGTLVLVQALAGVILLCYFARSFTLLK